MKICVFIHAKLITTFSTETRKEKNLMKVNSSWNSRQHATPQVDSVAGLIKS